MTMPMSVDNFLAGFIDSGGNLPVQESQSAIGPGSRLFDDSQASDDTGKVADWYSGDGEIVHGPQRLNPEQGVARNIKTADEIGFIAGSATGVGLFPSGSTATGVEESSMKHIGHFGQNMNRGTPILFQPFENGLSWQFQQP